MQAFRAASASFFCFFPLRQKRFPAAMRGRHAGNMGKTLSALGINHIHTRTGNVYRVVKV